MSFLYRKWEETCGRQPRITNAGARGRTVAVNFVVTLRHCYSITMVEFVAVQVLLHNKRVDVICWRCQTSPSPMTKYNGATCSSTNTTVSSNRWTARYSWRRERQRVTATSKCLDIVCPTHKSPAPTKYVQLRCTFRLCSAHQEIRHSSRRWCSTKNAVTQLCCFLRNVETSRQVHGADIIGNILTRLTRSLVLGSKLSSWDSAARKATWKVVTK